MDIGIWISFSSAVVAAVAAIFTGCTAWIARRNHRETIFLEGQRRSLQSASECLQIAYESIEPKVSGEVPIADRLAWLTSARNILNAKEMASHIEDTFLISSWKIEMEIWRARFYKLLSHPDLMHPGYFGTPGDGEAIHHTSAYIITMFSKWDDGEEDPIDELNSLSYSEMLANLGGVRNVGLKTYLENLDSRFGNNQN